MIGLGDRKEWCREKFYQEQGCASAEGAPEPGFAGSGGACMAETNRERRRI